MRHTSFLGRNPILTAGSALLMGMNGPYEYEFMLNFFRAIRGLNQDQLANVMLYTAREGMTWTFDSDCAWWPKYDDDIVGRVQHTGMSIFSLFVKRGRGDNAELFMQLLEGLSRCNSGDFRKFMRRTAREAQRRWIERYGVDGSQRFNQFFSFSFLGNGNTSVA